MMNDPLVSAPMPAYKSHKTVWALKIASVVPDESAPSGSEGSVILAFENPLFAPRRMGEDYAKKHNPQAGGYYVQYQDGYESFSPAEAFESGYAPVGAEPPHRTEAHLKDVYAALGIEWGTDPFPIIARLTTQAAAPLGQGKADSIAAQRRQPPPPLHLERFLRTVPYPRVNVTVHADGRLGIRLTSIDQTQVLDGFITGNCFIP